MKGTWIHEFLRRRGQEKFSDIEGWRTYYFNQIVLLSVVFVLISFAITFTTWIERNIWGILLFDIAILVYFGIMYFVRHALTRWVMFFFLLYAMVITYFITLGPFYVRPGWLVLCSVTAALLFGVPAALAAVGFNAVILLVLYFFIGPRLQSWSHVYTESDMVWFIFVVNLSIVSLLASLPVSLLLRKLSAFFSHEQNLQQRLLRESEAQKETNAILSREIAERKRIEEELRESREVYTRLVDTIPDVIVRLGLDGKILFVNDYALQISGYSRDELEGQDMLKFIAPEDQGKAIENTLLMMEGKLGPQGYHLIMKDGRKIPFEVNGDILKNMDGTPFGIVHMCRDVSERKRAERALQESEEKYRQLFMNAPSAIYEVDYRTHRFISFNEIIPFLTGYSREELMQMDPWDLFTKESQRTYHDRMRMIKEGRDIPTSQEYALRKKDGGILWVNANIDYAFEGGSPVSARIVAHDITDRKRMEEALKKSAEYYRTVFESTATANIIIAEDTTILMANRDFARMSGYTRQELEGRISWKVFVHEDDLEKMETYHGLRRIDPEAAPSSYEFRFVNRDGEVRDVIIHVAVIPGTKESIASMIDITEWKRSEQARAESDARFQELAKLLPEIVYEADGNGSFTFVNQAWFEKFGYTQEDISRGVTVFDVVMPEHHSHMIASYRRLMKGESIGLEEFTGRKKDGSTFPALVHATAIYHDGKPVGHRGFAIDVTEKKNLEDQLLRAQKMQSIGTLAGGIAHDFNNLLMGILGNISLVLSQIDQNSPAADRLKSVEGYVHRGSELTKQLLGFARGGKYEVRPTDLGRFIQESSELFARTKKEIRIHHRTQEGLWTVEVDQGQMEQVLLNLYVNAWHAMPHGGDLYLSEENVELDDISVSPYEIAPGRFVKVTVTDTGTGMDEATRSRIFEPFFSTKERGRGTGLGLASVYGIVKNHGGFIHVESEKGIGSSFTLFLPASDKAVEEELGPKDEVQVGQGTILLIDDEEMIIDIGSRMIESLGYTVISATGGRAGLQAYEKDRDTIDLVILDMIMPEMSGKETFHALRRINQSVRVLLSSGYSLDSQAEEIMQSGCNGFIQKPFTMVEISKKIRSILDH